MKKVIMLCICANIVFNTHSIESPISTTNQSQAIRQTPEQQMTFTTAQIDQIPNGSVITYASKGLIGDVIRHASAINRTEGTLGLTHVGICIQADPREIKNIIEGKSEHKLAKSLKGKLMLKNLKKYYGKDLALTESDTPLGSIKRAFLLESNGTAKQVLSFILPHVQITPFVPELIQRYNGNIYARPLKTAMDTATTKSFVTTSLGDNYETNIRELVNSTIAKNKKAPQKAYFCSELVAKLYQPLLTIQVTSNVIPEYFDSTASIQLEDQKSADILQTIAESEITIKEDPKLTALLSAKKEVGCLPKVIRSCLFACCLG